MEVNTPQFVILNYEIKGHKAVLFCGGKKKLPQFSDAYKVKNLAYIAHP